MAYGSVRLKMYRDKGEIQTTLKRVLHVPTMSCNLLSAGAITDNGFRVILEESECFISTKAGKVIGSGRRENHLYILDGKAVLESNHAYVSMAQVSEADMWHRRLGHANDAVLKKLADGKVASGVSLGKHSERRFCEGCVLSKSVRTTPKPLGTKHTVHENHSTTIGLLGYALEIIIANFDHSAFLYLICSFLLLYPCCTVW